MKKGLLDFWSTARLLAGPKIKQAAKHTSNQLYRCYKLWKGEEKVVAKVVKMEEGTWSVEMDMCSATKLVLSVNVWKGGGERERSGK
jgi:hypothetical protein